MITKISANGSSDISILLVSPPPAAWANAGVVSIRTILVKRESTANASRVAGSGKFARTIAAAVPIATLAHPSFAPLAGSFKARYGCIVRKTRNVKKAPAYRHSRKIERRLRQVSLGCGETSVLAAKQQRRRADRARSGEDSCASVRRLAGP